MMQLTAEEKLNNQQVTIQNLIVVYGGDLTLKEVHKLTKGNYQQMVAVELLMLNYNPGLTLDQVLNINRQAAA